MSKRKYTHIKLFEKEILEMKDAGKTKREIAEALGLEKEQIKHVDSSGRTYYQLIVPNSASRQDKERQRIIFTDAELALYRLKILGVVEDWTVEFHPCRDNIHPSRDNILTVYPCTKITGAYVKENLIKYIRRIIPDFPRSDRQEDAKYMAIMEDKSSQHGSVPRKSAKNAVLLRYLRGGFK